MTNLLREDTHHAEATPTQRRLAHEHAERMKRWHVPAKPVEPVAAPPPEPPPPPLPAVTAVPVEPDSIKAWIDGWRGRMPRMLSYRHVQQTTAEHFNLTRTELISGKRQHRIAGARQVAMTLCLELVPGASLPKVGKWFGDRDHTTVLHAHNRTKARIAADPDFAAFVETIRQALKAIEPTT